MANRRFAGLVTGAFLVATTALVGITDVADAVPVPVVEIDFNDGTWGDWVQSGGPALSVVDDAGNGVLQVANRSNDFDGIKSPAMFEAGVEYVFSMEVKLATPGTAQFRFVTDPGFTWIGNTTVNGDGWTTVSGAFTPEPGRRRLHRQRSPFGRRQPVHVPRRRHRGHHRIDRTAPSRARC